MAGTVQTKCEDVDQISYNFRIDNVSDLKSYKSTIFWVNGNPFSFEVKRIMISPSLSFLGLLLHSEIKNVDFDWAIVSSFVVELFPADFRQAPKVECFEPTSFHSETSKSDNSRIIAWSDLIDTEKGYVKDDTLKLRIKVKSTPLQDTTNDGWCRMETIENCCDDCSFGKFRIAVNRFDEYGICTPKFVVNNMTWRVQINVTDGESFKRQLRIKLYNNTCSTLTTLNCQTLVTCKLVSFDSEIEPKESSSEHKFIFSDRSLTWDLASWDDLIDAEKHFIRNNSFILELKIQILETNNLTRKRKANGVIDADVSIGCPVCSDSLISRDISVLPCGHIYCSPCAMLVIQKKFCPSCDGRVMFSLTQLRRCFLPILPGSSPRQM